MNLETLAAHYQPNQSAQEVVRQSDTLLLVGISGAGKDTIQSRLLEKEGYHKIVTHTTRPPRENNGVLEQDGREYHFVSFEAMQLLLEEHELIEVNHYGTQYYGTSVEEFRIANASRAVAVGNIDVNGITSFRALAGDAVRALFILPPSYEVWLQRLAARYSSPDELRRVFPERRQTAIDELEHALGVPYYHFIINDELDRSVRVVDEIAHRRNVFNRHDDEARLLARDLLEAIQASPQL